MNRHVVLATLLVAYIFNQWSRYLFNYTSAVAIKACPGTSPSDICHVDKGKYLVTSTCGTCPLNNTADYWAGCEACRTCLGENNAAFYNIKVGACLTSEDYGLISGYGTTIIYVVAGVFAGRLADSGNRVLIISAALIVWSSATAWQAFAVGFPLVLSSQLLLGGGLAFLTPAAYSLIAAYFPPDSRATANGIYSLGVYLGGAMSSLSLTLSTFYGYRATTIGVAISGCVVAMLFALLIKEPERDMANATIQLKTPLASEASSPVNQEDHAKPNQRVEEGASSAAEGGAESDPISLLKALAIIVRSPQLMLLFLGSAFRFFGGFALGSYLPIFYQRKYPAHNAEYGVINAFVISIGGALSSFLGGYLTDMITKRAPYTDVKNKVRSMVPALGCLIGLPLFCGVVYVENFYLSLTFLFLKYLFAESWFGPTIAILQSLSPLNGRGIMTGLYLFFGTLIGTCSPAILGELDKASGGDVNIGFYILIMVAVSYLSTILFFGIFTMSLWLKKPEKTEQGGEVSGNENPLFRKNEGGSF